MSHKNLTVEFVGEEPNALLETASITEPLPPREVAATIAAVVARADELADDLMIALEVRSRDAVDTGERIVLEEFMLENGYDPADHDLRDGPSHSPA